MGKSKLIGVTNVEKRLTNMYVRIDNGSTRMLDRLSKNFFNEVKPITPVDTGRMRDAWKISPMEVSVKGKQIEVYTDAVDPTNGYFYPPAQEYGYAHYVYGRYIGFRPGRYFRETASKRIEFDKHINDFLEGVVRSW
jgi:hypothetical protein